MCHTEGQGWRRKNQRAKEKPPALGAIPGAALRPGAHGLSGPLTLCFQHSSNEPNSDFQFLPWFNMFLLSCVPDLNSWLLPQDVDLIIFPNENTTWHQTASSVGHFLLWSFWPKVISLYLYPHQSWLLKNG